MNQKRVLLIVGGGIAAYKSLELVRGLKKAGHAVRVILTEGGSHFVTPLSLSALSEDKVYGDLWSLTDEAEMGHIQLSRDAGLLVVAPATADLLARMALGMADDLAATTLLATDKPVLVAPAMNVRMWEHGATQANVGTLRRRGIAFVGPNEGEMGCGEFGTGRMAEPAEIVAAIDNLLATPKSLAGRTALVTSGPTHEPIDPVRYLGNRSSGKQGHAVAAALARLGARVTLVSGPTELADPAGVTTIRVRTALEMLAACEQSLPADVAICAAAVADWRVESPATGKIKKSEAPPQLKLVENADILATIGRSAQRPRLVVGFAAETDGLIANADAKRRRKGCDWLLANPVDQAGTVFGSDWNAVTLLSDAGSEKWEETSKLGIAECLARRVSRYFDESTAPAR